MGIVSLPSDGWKWFGARLCSRCREIWLHWLAWTPLGIVPSRRRRALIVILVSADEPVPANDLPACG